jgi:hypothetical protein
MLGPEQVEPPAPVKVFAMNHDVVALLFNRCDVYLWAIWINASLGLPGRGLLRAMTLVPMTNGKVDVSDLDCGSPLGQTPRDASEKMKLLIFFVLFVSSFGSGDCRRAFFFLCAQKDSTMPQKIIDLVFKKKIPFLSNRFTRSSWICTK